VNRPYIGSAGLGKFEPYEAKQVLLLHVLSRNFGPVPAENVVTRIRAYINGWNEIQMLNPVEFVPTTLLPTQIGSVALKFPPLYYLQILSGTNVLTLCVTYRYDGDPRHQSRYSLSQRFDYGIAPLSGSDPSALWVSGSGCPDLYR
jgi:hypothetical protein